MMITHAEFYQSLRAHQLIQHNLSYLDILGAFWNQWAFDDQGAHYVEPSRRSEPNKADTILFDHALDLLWTKPVLQ